MRVLSTLSVVLLILITTTICSAQELYITWPDNLKGKSLFSQSELIRYDDDKIKALAVFPGGLGSPGSLSVIDLDLTTFVLNANPVSLVSGKEKLEFEFLVRLGDHILVFSRQNRKKEKTVKLFCQNFNTETLTLDEAIEVMEVPNLYAPMFSGGTFTFRLSSDLKFLGVLYRYPKKPNMAERFGCAVIDSNAKLLFSRFDEYSQTQNHFVYDDFCISQKGELLIAGSLNAVSDIPLKTTDSSSQYIIFQVNTGTDEPKVHKIAIDGLVIKSMRIAFNTGGQLIGSGFFYAAGDAIPYHVFSVLMDLTNDVILRIADMPFSKQTFEACCKGNSGGGENSSNSVNSIGATHFALDCMVNRPGGGFYLIAEQYDFDTELYITANRSSESRTICYQKNLVVLMLSNLGEIESVIPIIKLVPSGSFYSKGYFMFTLGTDLHFIFPDNPENNSGTQVFPCKAITSEEGIATLATIDSTGLLHRRTLWEYQEYWGFVVGAWSHKLCDSICFVVAGRLGGCKMGVLRRKD